VNFEFNLRQVVERLVNSLVVEPVRLVEGRQFDVFDVGPGPLAMSQ
jgi:hypothetical protein